LAYNKLVDEVLVINRSKDAAMAAIMDVASACPQDARKISYAEPSRIKESDIVVFTAGVKMRGQTAETVFGPNLEMAKSIADAGPLKPSAICILVSTPIDHLAPALQKYLNFPANQVIGFGGDLDTNRLKCVLQNHGQSTKQVHVVGEHGGNAVAVYPDEANYETITNDLRTFWSKLAKHSTVEPRNLATADQVSLLIDSICTDSKNVHYVCGYHPEHKMYLTWPFKIGSEGTEEAVKVPLGPQATKDLERVVAYRSNSAFALA
jgi:malate dehydrogenase